MTLKRTIKLLKEYLKMNNVNKYRLDEINKIKYYFNNEIKERKDIIWYVKHIFIRFSIRHTSRYCGFFFNFNIYSRYGHK